MRENLIKNGKQFKKLASNFNFPFLPKYYFAKVGQNLKLRIKMTN